MFTAHKGQHIKQSMHDLKIKQHEGHSPKPVNKYGICWQMLFTYRFCLDSVFGFCIQLRFSCYTLRPKLSSCTTCRYYQNIYPTYINPNTSYYNNLIVYYPNRLLFIYLRFQLQLQHYILSAKQDVFVTQSWKLVLRGQGHTVILVLKQEDEHILLQCRFHGIKVESSSIR